MWGCKAVHKASNANLVFDMQAHRGGRGLMPENTVAAMFDAIDRGVTTLEMDLQLTKDSQVIVSHDPTFNSYFATAPNGDTLTPSQAKKIILHQLSYDSIIKYDVGLKRNPQFPRQHKMAAAKPLLSALLDSTEKYARSKGVKIRYNIEIKSNPGADGRFYPSLENFVYLAMSVIQSKNIAQRMTIQSFDGRALKLLHQKYPDYTLSFLIDAKEKRSVGELITSLGFQPEILSPNSQIVTKTLIKDCHKRDMKIIPWTVNDLGEMKRLKQMGVDGIITDYPDLFSQL
ncbi:glycerophosphodiester phosphodiesterase family protein [Niabella insulamsoli]|uniref:glycerophosphodiester phosphodiesterase family protein n=1 Tax=Niabella insulamsoli TaxID=3144874 RepID=UPI0031FBE6FF